MLFLALLLVACGTVIDINRHVLDEKRINATHFQSVLDAKIRSAAEILETAGQRLTSGTPARVISEYAEEYDGIYRNDGLIILGYREGDLVFWNSNVLPVDLNRMPEWKQNELINPGNGWYVVIRHQMDDAITLLGLILVRHDYVFENEFLVNDFHDDFRIYPEAELSTEKKGTHAIFSPSGEFLFSIAPPSSPPHAKTFAIIACCLYLAGIIFLFLFLHRSFNRMRFGSNASKNSLLVLTIIALAALRLGMLETGFPQLFREFSIFQPHLYAKSSLFPSLGDLLMNTALIFFISIFFTSHFKVIDRETKPCRTKSLTWVFALSLLLSGFMFLFHYIFSGLIYNSNIQLEVHNFFYLNRYSLVAYLTLAMLLGSVVLFTDKVVFLASTLVGVRTFLAIFLMSFAGGFAVYKTIGEQINIYALLFFIVLTFSMTGIRYFKYRYTYSLHLFLVLLVSLFSLAFITSSSSKKEKGVRQVIVMNLANERDQVAEFLFEEIEYRMGRDSFLINTLSGMYYEDHELYNYLETNYFSGYFRKYELQVAPCGHDFDLWLEDVGELVDCYGFFYEMADEHGIPISRNSGFYFLDNLNGRISYLGMILFEFDDYPWEKTLFISLDSKLLSDQLGYPELLLEGKFSRSPSATQYSNAKYNQGQLITRTGTYSYPLRLHLDTESDYQMDFVREGGYEHLTYRVDDDNVIVVSKPLTTTIDLITSFSYSFAFFYLLYGLALLAGKYPPRLKKLQVNFKNKIKFSMIGVLLLSLVIIGAGTVYYNIMQFENKQFENITEKIQSVLIELEYRLGIERELSPDMKYYVTELLIQFSNVFYTDINLYDIEGNLYASSRPEVFDLGLTGEKMNPVAYSEMVINNNARFVHSESISSLSFLSAYVPFTNTNNEILAYLNLPYFTRHYILTKEIYTLVVAVANIYAVLILITILIAVIVSNTITKPLQLIQDKLRELSLGRKNEQIDYESDDEIGSLIREYNRMVEELENSAGILARSERESAWREMAKQIAHEIKNPLTPMKLSIQHLQRAWEDKTDNWEEVLKKTTGNLVEQIDHLSSIATAFSHFAKLPGAVREPVNITETIKNVSGLFSNSGNINIDLRLNGNEDLHVISDRMQLNRILVNLLKNSTQAIPKSRRGAITIELKREEGMALVEITDNGEGIHPSIKDKMFTPYFTSKSGGTGLGLAIVKNIAEQYGGSVGFLSEFKKGSCFWFRLPLATPENMEAGSVQDDNM